MSLATMEVFLNDFSQMDVLKLLNGILDGISDIIGVYTPDNSILFYNNTGYRFFNQTPESVKGKKCYHMLDRGNRCSTCTTQMALESKKLVRIVKYIPEMDRHMECTATPVFNREGSVELIIEQLRDITAQIKNELLIKQSEERYRSLVELSPDGIVVIRDNKIQMANSSFHTFLGTDGSKLVGRNIFELIHADFHTIAMANIQEAGRSEKTPQSVEYRLLRTDGEVLYVEAAASRLFYNDVPAVQIVMRNITERKLALGRAAMLQRRRLESVTPFPDKTELKVVYRPAEVISGDFYQLSGTHDNKIIGIIGDVSGKGISAALDVSAMCILFHEALELYDQPEKILSFMNSKIEHHLGEDYVAACCFCIDLDNNILQISGAAINEFIIKRSDNFYLYEVPGTFLGMFKDSSFIQEEYDFEKGDELYFYTDGFELLKDNVVMKGGQAAQNKASQIAEWINYALDGVADIADDCTALVLKVI